MLKCPVQTKTIFIKCLLNSKYAVRFLISLWQHPRVLEVNFKNIYTDPETCYYTSESYRTVSCKKRTVSCKKRTVSCKKRFVPCRKRFVPCRKRFVPCKKRTVPCKACNIILCKPRPLKRTVPFRTVQMHIKLIQFLLE